MSRARGALAALALGALAGGCMPAASAPETKSERLIPVVRLSEDQDEWLHDHCAYRGLGAGVTGAATSPTQVADANLAEVLYEHGTASDLAVFACRTRPPFLAVDLESIEERWAAAPAPPADASDRPAARLRAPEPAAWWAPPDWARAP